VCPQLVSAIVPVLFGGKRDPSFKRFPSESVKFETIIFLLNFVLRNQPALYGIIVVIIHVCLAADDYWV
jgi:hypothetical protein